MRSVEDNGNEEDRKDEGMSRKDKSMVNSVLANELTCVHNHDISSGPETSHQTAPQTPCGGHVSEESKPQTNVTLL